MENEILQKLNDLNKYIPVIDYLLEKDENKHEKFKNIRTWITTKKKYPINVLEKIEQSIITQYRNLFLEDVKIPKYIMEIFNSNRKANCISVNLCSDEEDDDNNDEVIFVSRSAEKQCRVSDISDKDEKNRTNKTSQEPKADENHIVISPLQIKSEEKLFKRRADFLAEVGKSENKHHGIGNMETSPSPIETPDSSIPIICLSEDDDPVEPPESDSIIKLNDKKKRTLFANTTNFNEEDRDEMKFEQPNSLNKSSKIDLPSSLEPKELEDMDIDELTEIFENFTKESGIDVESLMHNLNTQASQTVHLNKNQETQSRYVQGVCRNVVNSVISSHSNLASMPIFQAYTYPAMHRHLSQRLNLKDPRIIKQLQSLKNSPVYPALVSETPSIPGASIPANEEINNTTKAYPLSKAPITYGDYKRLNAEKERNKEAGNSNKQSSGTEQSVKKEEPNLTAKPRRDAKDILLSTLQPYEDKILDVLRKEQANKGGPTIKKSNKQDDTNGKKAKVGNNELLRTPCETSTKKMPESDKAKEKTNIVKTSLNTVSLSVSSEQCKKSIKRKKSFDFNKEHAAAKNQKQSESDSNQEQITVKVRKPNELDSIKEHTALKIRKPSELVNKMLLNSELLLSPPHPSGIRNYKTHTEVLKKQPTVLLHRLTESDIRKYEHRPPTRRISIHEKQPLTLNVELVENAAKKSKKFYDHEPSGSIKPCIKHKNIDCLMTERNTKLCIICKSKPSDLTNHYRKCHKTESYVSRLTWEELDDLQLNVQFAEEVSSSSNMRVKRFRIRCVFCGDDVEDGFINLFMHYSIHTGEYAFQCGGCKLEKPFRVDIQSHQCHSKICRGSRVQTLYQYPPNVMVIHLHCCKICNFVQLNEANVLKHLRDHHDKKTDDAINVEKYILAAIKNVESPRPQTPETESETETFQQPVGEQPGDDNITVSNEPLTEDFIEQPSDINQPSITLLIDAMKNKKTEMSSESTNEGFENAIIHLPIWLPAEEGDIKPKLEDPEEFPNSEGFMEEFIQETSTTINSMEIMAKTPRLGPTNIPHQYFRSYPEGTHYLGLFKCMAADCYFSCDVDSEMLQHLSDHCRSECPPFGYLCCAYCSFNVDGIHSPKELVAHVRHSHGNSRFQCSNCCYRSFAPGQSVIHQQFAHGKDANSNLFVYECEPPPHASVEAGLIAQLSLARVQPFSCSYCPSQFYSCNRMKCHLLVAHKFRQGAAGDHLISSLDLYACIYCSKTCNGEEKMQNHLAIAHPDQLPYTCLRQCRNETEGDSVLNLQLVSLRLPFVPPNKLKPWGLHVNTPNSQKNDDVQDVKPGLDERIGITEEIAKTRLLRLISKTGTIPERLFRCAQSECGGFFSTYDSWYRHMSRRHKSLISICPHCPNGEEVELSLNDFKEHFKQHMCHLFMCFNCGQTFSNEQLTKEHIGETHHDATALRTEQVRISLKDSISILVANDECADKLSFLTTLQDVALRRLQQMEKSANERLNNQWPVASSTAWLEQFPGYALYGNRPHKCLYPGCAFQTSTNEDLYEHMRGHPLRNYIFSCSKCNFKTKCSTWSDIIDHVNMHKMNLYICCTCSYCHHDSTNMFLHKKSEHKLRDVAVLKLVRSSHQVNVAVSVFYAEGKKSFTMRSCFGCSKSNLSMDTYALHLKRSHNLSMKYYCSICNEQIIKLSDSDIHLTTKHPLEKLNIRCELLSRSQLEIKSVMPLIINIKPIFENDRSAYVFVKEEPIDEDSDGDIVLLDDDDVAICEESRAQRNENMNPHTIRCVNIGNLLSNNPHCYANINSSDAAVSQPEGSTLTTDSTQFAERMALRVNLDCSNIQLRPIKIKVVNNQAGTATVNGTWSTMPTAMPQNQQK